MTEGNAKLISIPGQVVGKNECLYTLINNKVPNQRSKTLSWAASQYIGGSSKHCTRWRKTQNRLWLHRFVIHAYKNDIYFDRTQQRNWGHKQNRFSVSPTFPILPTQLHFLYQQFWIACHSTNSALLPAYVLLSIHSLYCLGHWEMGILNFTCFGIIKVSSLFSG